MANFSLFHLYRFVLVTFVCIYLGSWLIAVLAEALPRRRTPRAPDAVGAFARVCELYGLRLRRDVLELAGLVAALVFLIALHGWRGPWM